MNERFIPKRLISIQGSKAHLIDRQECLGSRPAYAALSYCWGKREVSDLQLTTKIASLRQGRFSIDPQLLTPIMRDAISMARTLNIPYLWLDSLCILQDNDSDWEEQCVEVANVYNGALVTFCAASSTFCLEGFLQQRGARIRMPFQSARRPTISRCYDIQFK